MAPPQLRRDIEERNAVELRAEVDFPAHDDGRSTIRQWIAAVDGRLRYASQAIAASRTDLHYCQVALATCNETCGIHETVFWQQQRQLQECQTAYGALNTDYGGAVKRLHALDTSNLSLRYELEHARRTIDALKLRIEEPCPHLSGGAGPAGAGHHEVSQADRSLAGPELAPREPLKTRIKQLEQEKADMQREHEKEKAALMQTHQEAMSNAVDCILASERKIENPQMGQRGSERQEVLLATSPEPMLL